VMSECGEQDRSRFSHDGGCDADDRVILLEEQEDPKDPKGTCDDATAEVTMKGSTRVRASIVEADTKLDTRRGGESCPVRMLYSVCAGASCITSNTLPSSLSDPIRLCDFRHLSAIRYRNGPSSPLPCPPHRSCTLLHALLHTPLEAA
jgi:hypothetical protein